MSHFNRSGASGSDQPLTSILRNVLGPSPNRQAVKALARRCHQVARAYLGKKGRMDRLRTDVLGEDAKDLALDAIAGLFERDGQGRFAELRRFFRRYFEIESVREARSEEKKLLLGEALQAHVSKAQEAELESALRRLVWRTVGDWLFEAYRTADRPLSNQIRALKRAAKESGEAKLIEGEERPWIALASEEAASPELGERPSGRLMPIETMEACLAGAVAEASSTGDLLRRAIRALRSHSIYEAAYPVTLLAQAMRAARARVQSVTEIPGPSSGAESPPLRAREIEAMIENCLETVREEKRSTYVGQGKISRATYRAYVQALGDRLRAKFVPRDEAKPALRKEGGGAPEEGRVPYDLTHYEALARYLEDFSKETYRKKHRARFEYLFQEAEDRLKERLREAVPAADGQENG